MPKPVRRNILIKSDLRQDDYSVLKASSAIPFVCHPYEVNGVSYYDGALSDPVPIQKAFASGCDRVVLILTKPRDIPRTPGKGQLLCRQDTAKISAGG